MATIVLAFGQAKGVTGTYLALATLGGGLIPLILRKYLLKSHALSDFRTENFLFREELITVFKECDICFEITDIIVENPFTPLNKDECQTIKIGLHYKGSVSSNNEGENQTTPNREEESTIINTDSDNR